MLKLFDDLGVPLAPEKVHGPLPCLEFLGITLDTIRMEARLSEEKVKKLKVELEIFLHRKKCTKRELLSLVGSLSFACKVVSPGRPFLARLIKLSCTVKKMHHKVYLNKHAKEDITAWNNVLSTWNGEMFFLDVDTVQSPDLEFFIDAESSSGYAAYYKGSWFAVPWQPHQMEYAMSTMELYPIVVASFVWGSHWANKRILVHCDNEGTVAIINKGYSSTEPIGILLVNPCSITSI